MNANVEILGSHHSRLTQIVEQLRESKTSLRALGLLANALDELDRLNLLADEKLKGMLRKQAMDAETIYALVLDEGADSIPEKFERDIVEIIADVTRVLVAIQEAQ